MATKKNYLKSRIWGFTKNYNFEIQNSFLTSRDGGGGGWGKDIFLKGGGEIFFYPFFVDIFNEQYLQFTEKTQFS